MRRRSTVPNTYASGVASMLAWRSPERPARRVPRRGEPTCECGSPRTPGYKGCDRCLSIDVDDRFTRGAILRALESGDAMTLRELAEQAHRTPRVLLRNLPRLLDEGRVRWWWEPQDVVTRAQESRYGRYVEAGDRERAWSGGNRKVYRRTW